jgi:hypothetical protein
MGAIHKGPADDYRGATTGARRGRLRAAKRLDGEWEKVQEPGGLAHAITYTLPFMFLTLNPIGLAVIAGTHFFIDRFRLARYVIWFKHPWPGSKPWAECHETGFARGFRLLCQPGW